MSGTCKACNKVLADHDQSIRTIVDELGKTHSIIEDMCLKCRRKCYKPDDDTKDVVKDVYQQHEWYVTWEKYDD